MKNHLPSLPSKAVLLPAYNYFLLLLLLFLSLLPLLSVGQNASPGQDILPILECTEYIGNGKFRANFGYDNLNKKEVTVAEINSYLSVNDKPASAKPPRIFKAGRQQHVFSTEFESTSKIIWRIILPNGKTKEIQANASSSIVKVQEIISLLSGTSRWKNKHQNWL